VKNWRRSYENRKIKIGLALSGGGSKAFYSLGLATFFREQGIRFNIYAGTSAGAAMAIADATGTNRDTVQYFMDLARANKKNFYVSNLLRGKTPFPHLELYKLGIRNLLDFEKLRKLQNVKFRIPAAIIGKTKYGNPKTQFYRTSLVFYLSLQYLKDLKNIKKNNFKNLLQTKASALNIRETVFSEKDFTSLEMVEKIILVSSSVPLVLKPQVFGQNYMLDGALISNMPIYLLEDADVKVGVYYSSSMKKVYHEKYKDALLFAPSRELPIDTFEYADPVAIKETFDLGYEDGALYYPVLRKEVERTLSKKSPLYKISTMFR